MSVSSLLKTTLFTSFFALFAIHKEHIRNSWLPLSTIKIQLKLSDSESLHLVTWAEAANLSTCTLCSANGPVP